MKSVKVFTFLASLPSRSEHHGMMSAIQKGEKARQNQLLCSRDETLARNPPIGGLFDESPEHSVRMGVRGGAGRTRTSDQTIMSGQLGARIGTSHHRYERSALTVELGR